MIKNWKINKKCNLVECNVVCQEIVLAPIFLLFLDSISAIFRYTLLKHAKQC